MLWKRSIFFRLQSLISWFHLKMHCSVFPYCNCNERLLVQFLYRTEEFIRRVFWYVSWPQEWSCCHVALFCLASWLLIRTCYCIKQSGLHSCWCLKSNEKAVITQESVVFQRGNPKTEVCTVSTGEVAATLSFPWHFPFFILSLLSTLLSLQKPFIESSVTDSCLEIPKNPAHGLKAM